MTQAKGIGGGLVSMSKRNAMDTLENDLRDLKLFRKRYPRLKELVDEGSLSVTELLAVGRMRKRSSRHRARLVVTDDDLLRCARGELEEKNLKDLLHRKLRELGGMRAKPRGPSGLQRRSTT